MWIIDKNSEGMWVIKSQVTSNLEIPLLETKKTITEVVTVSMETSIEKAFQEHLEECTMVETFFQSFQLEKESK